MSAHDDEKPAHSSTNGEDTDTGTMVDEKERLEKPQRVLSNKDEAVLAGAIEGCADENIDVEAQKVRHMLQTGYLPKF